MKRHVTRHATAPDGDALDLFAVQSERLRAEFAEWEATRPDPEPGAGHSEAPAQSDNGTLAKLVLEHAAVWLAASQDLARVLAASGGSTGSQPASTDLSKSLAERGEQARRWLARMDELSRGQAPVAVGASSDLAEAVLGLRETLSASLGDDALPGRVAHALGPRRRQLRSAEYLRKHAPTHPGPHRWYHRVGPLVRLHTAYDRARGVPWAESERLASARVAERYKQEG